MSRMVSLEDWAKDEFGEEAPSVRTLKAYAKGKMMAPPAVKVGRKWMIDRGCLLAKHSIPFPGHSPFQCQPNVHQAP